MKLSIGKKILLGYVPALLLLIIISLYTLYKLYQVNRINTEIISVDLVINQSAGNLIDILLAQESFGQRYMILKSQDMLSLFWKRNQEFSDYYKKIKELSTQDQLIKIVEIDKFHTEYNHYFKTGIQCIDSPNSMSFLLADSLRKSSFDNQVNRINNLVSETKQNQLNKTWKTAEIGRLTFKAVSVVSIFGIIIVIGIAMFITRGILKAIKILKTATAFVSQGNFINLPSLKNNDELGDLSQAFNEMAERLKQLEEIYKDASPLTRLPGGISIENTVIKRIKDKVPFAFCMLDLDNFKPFNDRYGYSRGNAVIKNTAKIIKDCIQDLGNESDFVGHIGGDDFALISTPDKFKIICNTIIKRFDDQIHDFYNPEDKEKGYIQSKNRQEEELSFPIMTISISVINTEKSYVENYIQVGEIIAELKKYAKSFLKSIMVIDRRGGRTRSNLNRKNEKVHVNV